MKRTRRFIRMQWLVRRDVRLRSLRAFNTALSLICVTVATVFAGNVQPIADKPFVQEYRDEVAYPKVDKANQVRSIAAGTGDTVWIATKAGVFQWRDGA